MTAAPLDLPKSEIFQAIQKKIIREIEQPVRSHFPCILRAAKSLVVFLSGPLSRVSRVTSSTGNGTDTGEVGKYAERDQMFAARLGLTQGTACRTRRVPLHRLSRFPSTSFTVDGTSCDRKERYNAAHADLVRFQRRPSSA